VNRDVMRGGERGPLGYRSQAGLGDDGLLKRARKPAGLDEGPQGVDYEHSDFERYHWSIEVGFHASRIACYPMFSQLLTMFSRFLEALPGCPWPFWLGRNKRDLISTYLASVL
jgi:hypothetical protein